VDDLIEGLWRFMNSGETGPMNLGNPEEIKIIELAHTIGDLAGGGSEIAFVQRPVDDPELRCPDITLAQRELGWRPKVSLLTGMSMTIEWARNNW
jgi:dTDP-glucose 4,6-dehydratase